MKDGNWRINKSPSTRNEYRRSWFQTVRRRTIEALGGKCVRCSYTDIRALQVDHLFPGADTKEDQKKKGTSYYYAILKKIDSGRYQVLCSNCNVIKRFENQECPLKGKDGPNP